MINFNILIFKKEKEKIFSPPGHFCGFVKNVGRKNPFRILPAGWVPGISGLVLVGCVRGGGGDILMPGIPGRWLSLFFDENVRDMRFDLGRGEARNGPGEAGTETGICRCGRRLKSSITAGTQSGFSGDRCDEILDSSRPSYILDAGQVIWAGNISDF